MESAPCWTLFPVPLDKCPSCKWKSIKHIETLGHFKGSPIWRSCDFYNSKMVITPVLISRLGILCLTFLRSLPMTVRRARACVFMVMLVKTNELFWDAIEEKLKPKQEGGSVGGGSNSPPPISMTDAACFSKFSVCVHSALESYTRLSLY